MSGKHWAGAVAAWLLVLIVCWVGAGCQSSSSGGSGGGDGGGGGEVKKGSGFAFEFEALEAEAAGEQKNKIKSRAEGAGIDLPEVLRALKVRVRQSEVKAGVNADWTLEEVVESLDPPGYLEVDATAVVDAEAGEGGDDSYDAELSPSAAVLAYTMGRDFYRNADFYRAIEDLERARKIDPHSPQIVRLLGMVYFSRGDDVRGAKQLEQSIRLEPNDATSLFLLGRFAYQKGRWEEAAVTLYRSRTASQERIDAAVGYLRPFYLGQVLSEMGYDAAAIESFSEYLRMPGRFARTTRLHREVAFLTRQRGQVVVEIGDALMRLGRVDEAFEVYGEARSMAGGDPELLLARQIYALLVMGREAGAEALFIRSLLETGGSDITRALAEYVEQYTLAADRYAALLEGVYEKSGRSGRMALVVLDQLDADRKAVFLGEHFEARPLDLLSHDELVGRLAELNLGKLVGLILKSIEEEPEDAARFIRPLANLKLNGAEVIAAIDKLSDPETSETPEDPDAPETGREESTATAAAWYLRGAIYEADDQINAASAAFERAVAADADFDSPRLATVELQLRLGDYTRAVELLDELGDTDDARMRYARARALAGLKQMNEAMRLVAALISEEPHATRYRLFEARLRMIQQDTAGAERSLNAILEYDPVSEDAFAMLFTLLDSGGPDQAKRWMSLIQRVTKAIPTSRIARLKTALWYAMNGQTDKAAKGYLDVIKDYPGDQEALTSYVFGILVAKGDLKAAQDFLIEHIEGYPEERLPVLMLGEVSQQLGDLAPFEIRMEAFLNRQSDTSRKWQDLSKLYVRRADYAQAIEALQRAVEIEPELLSVKRLDFAQLYQLAEQVDEALRQVDLAIKEQPDLAADLYYFKAMIYHGEQQPGESEKMLMLALETEPDHAGANNDLGYLWAERDLKLEEALLMTTKAVRLEPENGAYLDSLGWVFYKLGRFEEATHRLEEARTKLQGEDPIILDHLGDALWRGGRKERAVEIWGQALRHAKGEEEQLGDDARQDVVAVRVKIEGKLDAAKADVEPGVEPIPGDEPRSTGKGKGKN